MSDRWKGSLDAWKTREPECDDPRSQEPGECERCRGSGWIAVNSLGRYLGPGPVPQYTTHRLRSVECDACGGCGVIADPEADE
jgi:hypothetical protein